MPEKLSISLFHRLNLPMGTILFAVSLGNCIDYLLNYMMKLYTKSFQSCHVINEIHLL